MTQRVNIYLEDEFAEHIRKSKPTYLSLSAFCSLLIAQSLQPLTEVAKVPAYRVGAGETNLSKKVKKQLLNEEINHPSNEETKQPSNEGIQASKNSSSLKVSLGESVGREVQEGTPRKPLVTVAKKVVPSELLSLAEEIQSFWKEKAGAKSPKAWNLLMTELKKIKEKYGEDDLRVQLELAAANRWKGVTLRNYEQFGQLAAKSSFQAKEAEPKHPAYKVFSAEDGFGESTINPVLKELF